MAKSAKITTKIVRSAPAIMVKMAMILIILIAAYATFTGALSTVLMLGYTGLAACGFAMLPDALMVLSAAQMRRQGLSPFQRKHAQRAMRFGLSFSVVTNMIGAFLHVAPNGSWLDSSSSQALWLQTAIAILTIMAHAVPVIILWLATEMITRPKSEPASLVKRKPAVIKPRRAPVLTSN